LCGAGVFRADPMSGFPPGTPSGRPDHVSWHGNLHFLSGAVAFLALIAACVVLARLFGSEGQRFRARASLATGIVFAAAFVGIATGSSAAVVVVAFGVAVVLAFGWLTWLCRSLGQDVR
jgi:hypothetical protein